jgi:hypothetical protein
MSCSVSSSRKAPADYPHPLWRCRNLRRPAYPKAKRDHRSVKVGASPRNQLASGLFSSAAWRQRLVGNLMGRKDLNYSTN